MNYYYIVLAIVSLLVVPTSTAMAQSGFSEYDNKYFTIPYPNGWTVNDTALGGDLGLCCDIYHTVSFIAPNNAIVRLMIHGPIHPPFGSVTLNKDYWMNVFNYGNVISIDNQTQYMLGKQALVATLLATNNNNKQMNVVAFHQVHFPADIADCTTNPTLMLCQPYQFVLMYTNNINDFQTYLPQFQMMVSKLHVNG
jgi:hypothetical protein